MTNIDSTLYVLCAFGLIVVVRWLENYRRMICEISLNMCQDMIKRMTRCDVNRSWASTCPLSPPSNHHRWWFFPQLDYCSILSANCRSSFLLSFGDKATGLLPLFSKVRFQEATWTYCRNIEGCTQQTKMRMNKLIETLNICQPMMT